MRGERTFIAALGAVAAGLIAFAGPAAGQTPGVPTQPILGSPLGGEAPEFVGSPATAKPVDAPKVPQHPFMAPNGRSNIHNDPFQSDTYTLAGPLGNDPEVTSTLFARECGSVAFDSDGRIVTVCVGLDRPVLAILDPVTLDTIAALPLPLRRVDGGNPFTDFSGGGYFYLDHKDRAVLPTNEGRLYTVAVRGDELKLVSDIDLTPAIGDGKVISVLPDWKNRIWFASKDGVVGWTDRKGNIASRDTGEVISNSFAAGQGAGLFIVTDAALYRFEAGSGDSVDVVWRQEYLNDGKQKPGQTSEGSGTTPTLLNKRYVAITDNADPMGIVVMDRRRKPERKRIVCEIDVLEKGAGSTDQSLTGIGRSLMVENNYGYSGVTSVQNGATTLPGLERVDIKPAKKLTGDPARNCKSKWVSEEIAPSVVPKLSLGAGLVYTYTKPDLGSNTDAWYFTALDWRTGKTRFKQLAGYGLGFNNNYAPVTIGPDGAAYVGVLGGLVRIADSG
jgi:hypothetical protein